jgi:hypothetical protein
MTALGNLDLQQARILTGEYFSAYSNGGYGRLPNPVMDDQRTTDQYVAQRMEFPSVGVERYYMDEHSSPFYQLDQNRALTMAQQFDALQQKGVRLVGKEKTGAYSVYASVPDPSGSVSLYSTNSETNTILWLVIGIGAIVLIANAVAPY